jgi:excinuclease ABC subunit C
VLQQARDEAHRFAVTFQRKRRATRTITSELLRIPGIGERKRRQLLEAFGSLEGVRTATPEAIAALPGFSLKSAAKIQSALNGTLAASPAETAAADRDQDLTTASKTGEES